MTSKIKIKNVILSGAGKGGTGKSTMSVLIALRLKELGYNVGLFDADVFGPSLPIITGTTTKLEGNPEVGVIPSKTSDGIPLLSIDLFLNETKTAILWKGNKVANYIKTIYDDINWGDKDIDFLVIDLSPGSSESVQTIISVIRESEAKSGILFISEPQKVSLHDILKSVSMAKKLQIPIIGIVENMTSFVCPNCNTEHLLFGSGNVERVCKEENIQYIKGPKLIPEISKVSDISLNIKTVPEEVKPYIAEITSKVLKFYMEK